MEIKWHGLSCFTIEGKNALVLVDPFDFKTAGIKLPTVSPDVVLANADNELHSTSEFSGKSTIFDWPGEFEAKDVIVQAIPAFDKTKGEETAKNQSAKSVPIFTMIVDGFKLCHLSNIGHKLTPEMLEQVGDTDIPFIPVGVQMDAKKAHEVIEQLDPRIVIPMYYKTPGLKLPLADLEPFLKEVGEHSPTREKSLKFQSPSQLPNDKMEFKILEPSLG